MKKESPNYALRPGTELKSKERTYIIEKVLGSGSFGITYLASSKVAIGNISTTIPFAIKEHFISSSCDRGVDGTQVVAVTAARAEVGNSRADFIVEATRLKKLCQKSRNIVSVNETFEANGTAYYVMEYLNGGSIKPCSEEDAITVVLQIAKALELIHGEKVLHLDVKPDNIVMKVDSNGDNYPVLIDFGISKHFDVKGKPTSSLHAKGATPGFAPQEQYAGVSEFSPKYDIYALGAVLFYMCTGSYPPDAFKVSPNQAELKIKLEGKVSQRVMKTILNAMKPSAMERTPTIKQFCDDLMGVDFVPVLNVSDKEISFGKGNESAVVDVKANIGWSAFSEAKWCKVTFTKDKLNISASKNKTAGNRSCTITLSGASYDVKMNIHVIQEGVGTIVIPHDRERGKWWLQRKRKMMQSIFLLFALCAIIVISFLPRPKKTPFPPAQGEDTIYTDSVSTGDTANLTVQNPTDTQDVSNDGNNKPQNDKEENIQQEKETPKKTVQEPKVTKTTNDELFRKARTISDYKSLADKGYAKAYAPLAMMYLKSNQYEKADHYSRLAVKSGVNISLARKVVNLLDEYQYYVTQGLEKPKI